jgi:hypothetical protein
MAFHERGELGDSWMLQRRDAHPLLIAHERRQQVAIVSALPRRTDFDVTLPTVAADSREKAPPSERRRTRCRNSQRLSGRLLRSQRR